MPAASFNHLVGALHESSGKFKSERLRSLEVQDQLELGRLHYWEVRWLFAFQNPPRIEPSLPIRLRQACPVAHQPAGYSVLAPSIDDSHGVPCRQSYDLITLAVKERLPRDYKGIGAQLSKSRKC